jgi:addiction module RelB/DinJ family antitoxin
MRHNSHMSAQTVLFRARVDENRLAEADGILARLGLTPADAFNAMLAQIILRRSLPFAVALAPEPRPAGTQEQLLDASEQGRVWEEACGDY